MRITVRRWTQDDDEPVISTYDMTTDGTWTKAGSEPGAAGCTLEEIIFVDPDGAIHVETSGATPSPTELAAVLPRSVEYLDEVDEIETDDDVLDSSLGYGLRQVAINGRRLQPFPLHSNEPEDVVWLKCDPEELENGRAKPIGSEIASASGIETGSMTSGWSSWSLLDVGGGYVCFVAEPDDFETEYRVEQRRGRTNRELAVEFTKWIDWGPVSRAVDRAIELGGAFDGVASELDSIWSDTCEVNAYVDLSPTD